MTTLVDSNVLIDFLDPDSEWNDWSASMLEDAGESGLVAINTVIYSEVSVTFDDIDDVELALPQEFFVRAAIPWEAAFLAGKAFEKYKTQGGAKRSPLPDFFIGAHAAVAGMTLLTRDPRRYRAYFPKLKLIAP
ncbi:MAG: DNA-binding protein [Acidobacteria bacterium 13_1_40CM_65_14]|nr:MAG: DNA-binding protein [Acidobacteria bacterium 13_1_40CM_65_14]OLC79487.1 MAG: DNA-binding protein [Acidobacteria bacterium 13_1_40CM_4_65_8]